MGSMMSTSQPSARTCAAGTEAVAVLPPPVPAAMNRCGSSSCRPAIHLAPPARVARCPRHTGPSQDGYHDTDDTEPAPIEDLFNTPIAGMMEH